jgi:hypothetical protein
MTLIADDRLIDLDDVSKLFTDDYDKSQYEIHNIISQAEHPVLFRPFFMIHPCKSKNGTCARFSFY